MHSTTIKTIACFATALLGILFACGDASVAGTSDPAACPTACVGAQGAVGPVGPQGPQGPTGLISKSHLYMVTGPDQAFDMGGNQAPNTFSTQITCKDPADAVINGGFDSDGAPEVAWARCKPTNVSDLTKPSGYYCDVAAMTHNGLGRPWVLCAIP